MGSFEGDPVASEESLTDIGIAVPKSHKRSKSSPRGCRNPQEAITTRLQSRTQVSYDAAEKKLLFHPTLVMLLLGRAYTKCCLSKSWWLFIISPVAPIRNLSPLWMFFSHSFLLHRKRFSHLIPREHFV